MPSMRKAEDGQPESVLEPVYKGIEALFFIIFGLLLAAALGLLVRMVLIPILQGHG